MPPSDRRKLDAALTRQKQLVETAPSEPDKKTKEEERDLENQRKKTLLVGLGQNIKERKKYAARFFALSCCWIIIITGVVLLDGWRWSNFWLPDKVVLALIGSTTINILGILYVVAHYLFPKRQ
jgi:hypothetical protein